MKKRWLLFTFLLLFPAITLYSQQLEYEVQIIDTTTYKQSTPDIVFFDPNTIFLTWTDYFPFQKRIFCAKSNDLGERFLPAVEPDPTYGTKVNSTVDIDGSGNPYLTWSDFRLGNLDIRFAKSLNGGTSFETSVPVFEDEYLKVLPQVKVSSNAQRVYVAWITLYGDTSATDSAKLFLSSSVDTGNTFSPPQQIGDITDNQQFSFSFDINDNGDTIAFVWEDHVSNNPELVFSSSINGGQSFFTPTVVDTNQDSYFHPSVSLYADSAYIVYGDDRTGKWNILMAATQVANLSFSYSVVDTSFGNQEQPSINIDTLGNIYVSYRNEETRMTYISVLKKGSPSFKKDWIGIYGFDNTNSRVAAKDTTNIFCTWEYHMLDTMNLTAFARSVPTEAPGQPKDLLANDANPSPWDSSGIFKISFVKPYDPSGIAVILYKIGSIPVHDFDTTGAFIDTSSTDTSTFVVVDSVEGEVPLFVWLMDGRGNLDYHNNSPVLLRHDRTPPTPTVKILPDSSSVVTDRQPFFLWHSSTDVGGAGIMTYVLALDTMPNFDTTSFFYSTGLDTSIILPDSLWDDFYYWTVIPSDSAGNLQFNVTVWYFIERATPPPVPIAPPDSGWVGKNYLLTWHKIPDPLAYVDKYFVSVASDSEFNNIILRDSTFGPGDTIMPINNWIEGEGYWHVRSRNIYRIFTSWSKRMFFRYDSIPPPAPILISPEDSCITNNPRPTFNWYPVFDSLSGIHRYIVAVFSDLALNDTVFAEGTPDTFLVPSSDLPEGNLYWIILARDFAGNFSGASDTFLLSIDTQPPFVTTVIPGDGSAGVPVASNIIVVFSEPVDASTINDTTFIVIDNLSYRYYGSFQYNSSFEQLTFNPNVNFYGGRNILVTIEKDVMDLAGNEMDSDYTWYFITESVSDSTGPIIYNLALSTDTVFLGQDIVVTATVSDSGRGNSIVSACELFMDSIGADSTGEMFLPQDGTFDYIIEDVIDTLKTGSIPYKQSHWLYVHGFDIQHNWGEYDSLQFWLVDTLPPEIDAVVSPDPSQRALLGKDFVVNVTSNKTLRRVPTCYVVGSQNNRLDIEIERDSLDTDSTLFSTTFTLCGLEPGPAMLYVEGRDLNNKVGIDSVNFEVFSEGGLLPEKRVYTWPNPASDIVHFRFYVARNAQITIEIFTITGRKIKTLSGTALGGDNHSEIVWSTHNAGSDLYVFRISATTSDESDSVVKRFAIVK